MTKEQLKFLWRLLLLDNLRQHGGTRQEEVLGLIRNRFLGMFRIIGQHVVLIVDLKILDIGSGVHKEKIGKWYLLLQVGTSSRCSTFVTRFQSLQLGDKQMQLMPVVIVFSLISLPLQAIVVVGQEVPQPTAEFLGALIPLAGR